MMFASTSCKRRVLFCFSLRPFDPLSCPCADEANSKLSIRENRSNAGETRLFITLSLFHWDRRRLACTGLAVEALMNTNCVLGNTCAGRLAYTGLAVEALMNTNCVLGNACAGRIA